MDVEKRKRYLKTHYREMTIAVSKKNELELLTFLKSLGKGRKQYITELIRNDMRTTERGYETLYEEKR